MGYLKGEGGRRYVAQKYGINDDSNIRKWVKTYEEFGDEGLKRSRTKKSYTFETKISVVELYLTTEISYQDLALIVGLANGKIKGQHNPNDKEHYMRTLEAIQIKEDRYFHSIIHEDIAHIFDDLRLLHQYIRKQLTDSKILSVSCFVKQSVVIPIIFFSFNKCFA